MPAFSQQVALEAAWPDIRIPDPVDLQHAGDGSGRVFVVSQAGTIYVLGMDESLNEAPVFLNISDRVATGAEMGLLGLAFHPQYVENGHFFVSYTSTSDGLRRTVISRFRVSSDDADAADPESELVLLEFYQPYSNHNAGQLVFGPEDGYLYIASGDGGGTGDPGNNAQNRSNLLGAILRIDVDKPDNDLHYGIPPGNPLFGNTSGFREEIFAWGLRNPRRMSFDPETGWLWAADVGQNTTEEINLIVNGGNYGWRRMKGTQCHIPETRCDTGGLIYPIHNYSHSDGERSVTGGYVYRGISYPAMFGRYIYGDLISGQIWALDYDGDNPPVHTELITADFNVKSLGTDQNGEIYLLAHNSDRIYRLVSELAPASLLSPVEAAEVYMDDFLRWSALPGSKSYEIIIAADQELLNVVYTASDITDTGLSLDTDLATERQYYWAVRAINSLGYSQSDVKSFYLKTATSLEEEEEIAQSVVLEQNYPNPFNSSTQIRFYLPEAMPVLLEVYSMNGQYITTLADGMRDGGEHVATFHAGALSTGIYISRLQTGTVTRARKMLLIK
ncbi:MAG: PQQ-dependent sugar dehydrogenase [Cyclonatronaceae bacterium]